MGCWLQSEERRASACPADDAGQPGDQLPCIGKLLRAGGQLHDPQPPARLWCAQVAREIRIHLELAHPSIIAMFAAWSDATYVYIAMEWAPEVSRRAGQPGAGGICC